MWDSLPPVTATQVGMNIPGIADVRKISSMGLFEYKALSSLGKDETGSSGVENGSNTFSGSPRLRPSKIEGVVLDNPRNTIAMNGRLREDITPNRGGSLSPATSPALLHHMGSADTDAGGGHHSELSFPMLSSMDSIEIVRAFNSVTQTVPAPRRETPRGVRTGLDATMRPGEATHLGVPPHTRGTHTGQIDDPNPILGQRVPGMCPISAWEGSFRRESHAAPAVPPPSVHSAPYRQPRVLTDEGFISRPASEGLRAHTRPTPPCPAPTLESKHPPRAEVPLGALSTMAMKDMLLMSSQYGPFRAPTYPAGPAFDTVRASTTTTTATASTQPTHAVRPSSSAMRRLSLQGPPPSSFSPPSPSKRNGSTGPSRGRRGPCPRVSRGSAQGSHPQTGPGGLDSLHFPETVMRTTVTTTEAPPTAGGSSSLQITSAEVRQVFEAFCARYESYQQHKKRFIEAYLGKIEQAVDQYLAQRFKPKKLTDNVLSKAGENILKMGAKLFKTAMNAKKSGSPSRGGGSSFITTPQSSANLIGTAGCFGCDEASQIQVPSLTSVEEGSRVPSDSPPPPCYTPNVICSEYLDSRPDEATLNAVRQNYPIIVHVMKNVFYHPTNHAGGVLDNRRGLEPSPCTSPPFLALSSPASAPQGYDLKEHQAIHSKLIAPLVESTWREYLAPLEMRIQELLLVLDQNVLPAYQQYEKSSCGASMDADLQHVLKLQQSLGNDLEYVVTIRGMDQDFLSRNHALNNGRNEGVADPVEGDKKCGLSDYVPVHGLILSRLHRLEMEHRSVLELWAGQRPCSTPASAGSSPPFNTPHPVTNQGPSSPAQGSHYRT
ncbi:unnamed protein product [Phytomonas sp. EM1]|nr:unnamed protein product [Phytomonas sp. EM1]|eukprot:CCW65350.1 unnamed protein product [Phytomonas sp. isolate EM1]